MYIVQYVKLHSNTETILCTIYTDCITETTCIFIAVYVYVNSLHPTWIKSKYI